MYNETFVVGPTTLYLDDAPGLLLNETSAVETDVDHATLVLTFVDSSAGEASAALVVPGAFVVSHATRRASPHGGAASRGPTTTSDSSASTTSSLAASAAAATSSSLQGLSHVVLSAETTRDDTTGRITVTAAVATAPLVHVLSSLVVEHFIGHTAQLPNARQGMLQEAEVDTGDSRRRLLTRDVLSTSTDVHSMPAESISFSESYTFGPVSAGVGISLATSTSYLYIAYFKGLVSVPVAMYAAGIFTLTPSAYFSLSTGDTNSDLVIEPILPLTNVASLTGVPLGVGFTFLGQSLNIGLSLGLDGLYKYDFDSNVELSYGISEPITYNLYKRQCVDVSGGGESFPFTIPLTYTAYTGTERLCRITVPSSSVTTGAVQLTETPPPPPALSGEITVGLIFKARFGITASFAFGGAAATLDCFAEARYLSALHAALVYNVEGVGGAAGALADVVDYVSTSTSVRALHSYYNRHQPLTYSSQGHRETTHYTSSTDVSGRPGLRGVTSDYPGCAVRHEGELALYAGTQFLGVKAEAFAQASLSVYGYTASDSIGSPNLFAVVAPGHVNHYGVLYAVCFSPSPSPPPPLPPPPPPPPPSPPPPPPPPPPSPPPPPPPSPPPPPPPSPPPPPRPYPPPPPHAAPSPATAAHPPPPPLDTSLVATLSISSVNPASFDPVAACAVLAAAAAPVGAATASITSASVAASVVITDAASPQMSASAAAAISAAVAHVLGVGQASVAVSAGAAAAPPGRRLTASSASYDVLVVVTVATADGGGGAPALLFATAAAAAALSLPTAVNAALASTSPGVVVSAGQTPPSVSLRATVRVVGSSPDVGALARLLSSAPVGSGASVAAGSVAVTTQSPPGSPPFAPAAAAKFPIVVVAAAGGGGAAALLLAVVCACVCSKRRGKGGGRPGHRAASSASVAPALSPVAGQANKPLEWTVGAPATDPEAAGRPSETREKY